jgi:hypothetical protein
LVETLSTQAALAASARHIGGGLPVIASPVTLRRRFNPHAIAPEAAPPPGSLPAPVDPRQMSLFGACWTAGSVKYLATGGAASVTYFETTGWRGVMETETGSPAEPFRSLGGAVFPLYHVLAEAGRFRGGEVLDARSSDPLAVEGLALRKDAATSLLVSNMSGETQTVEIRGLGAPIKVRRLDVGSVVRAMHDPERFADSGQPGNSSPMALSPYATAILSFADSAGEGGYM